MRKSVISVLLLCAVILTSAQCSQSKQQQDKLKNLYDFEVTDIDGNKFDMAQLKGKKVMIVNVASKCGLTPQYEQLQELYDEYKNSGFVIIGFPANNFKDQESGSNEEIKGFCSLNYGVTFPMMSKISVVGDDKAPIYQWLTQKSENGKIDQEVIWNFQKFLIDEKGNLMDVVLPKESPKNETIMNWLNGK